MNVTEILSLLDSIHTTVQTALGRNVHHGILHGSKIIHQAAECGVIEIPEDDIQPMNGGQSFRQMYRGAVRLHYKVDTPIHSWLPERARVRRALERWWRSHAQDDLVNFYVVTTKPFLNDKLNNTSNATVLTIPIYWVLVVDENTEE